MQSLYCPAGRPSRAFLAGARSPAAGHRGATSPARTSRRQAVTSISCVPLCPGSLAPRPAEHLLRLLRPVVPSISCVPFHSCVLDIAAPGRTRTSRVPGHEAARPSRASLVSRPLLRPVLYGGPDQAVTSISLLRPCCWSSKLSRWDIAAPGRHENPSRPFLLEYRGAMLDIAAPGCHENLLCPVLPNISWVPLGHVVPSISCVPSPLASRPAGHRGAVTSISLLIFAVPGRHEHLLRPVLLAIAAEGKCLDLTAKPQTSNLKPQQPTSLCQKANTSDHHTR
jgi:hypothetical protein